MISSILPIFSCHHVGQQESHVLEGGTMFFCLPVPGSGGIFSGKFQIDDPSSPSTLVVDPAP